MRETLIKSPIIVAMSLLVASVLCPSVADGSDLPGSTTPAVSPIGWELQDPPIQWSDLYGIWGSSASDVFAVGDHGGILHYDGVLRRGGWWTAMTTGTTDTLFDIWGSSSSNVFAVGEHGTILQYDGTTWGVVSSGAGYDLFGVWGSSSSNVYAVGDAGTILYYDGITWSPMGSSSAANLHGVWGRSSSDIFAVGSAGTILHYNAIAWAPVSSGTSADLYGVSGNMDYTYAVGSSGTVRQCRVGSTTWCGMATGTTNTLHGIWGDSSSNVFAVGAAGADQLLHYDGSAWHGEWIFEGYGADLWDIWGTSLADVFAVGYASILRGWGDNSGINWGYSMADSATRTLVSIWAASPSSAFAIGPFGALLQYDGSKWNLTSMGLGPSADIEFEWFDVWGSSSSDVYITGMGIHPDFHPNYVRHFDGSAWMATEFDTHGELYGIWGSSSSDVFVVGSACNSPLSTIQHYDGSVWSPMTSNTTAALQDVWGSASCDVFAIGSGGTIIHYDGSEWSPMSSPMPYDLIGVWGSSSTDVFAVGRDGIILHYDGIEWSRMNSGTGSNLNDVWGSSPTDVFAVGDSGTIVHYDGIAWSSMSSGTTRDLHGVWGAPSCDVFAVGSEGTILHYAGLRNTSPSQPTNVSPANGATAVSLTPSLRSAGFSDSDAGDTHAASQWQVRSATGDYSNSAFDSGTDSTNLTEIQVPLGALAYSTTYWWHVRHQDSRGGWSDWSCETSFTAPPPPQAEFDFTCVRVSRAVMLVFFSSLSCGGVAPLTYAWDFESDGAVDATEREPWHRYMASGTYTVSLTITDAVGNTHTETKADCITVLSPGRGKHGNGGRADQHGFRHWRLLAQWSAFRSPIARPCPPGPSLPCGG